MSKITESARDAECQIQGPTCNENPETVVFCHLGGAGMGRKDVEEGIDMGSYGCSECHRWVDGGYLSNHPGEVQQMKAAHLAGTIRTMRILIGKGLVKCG